MYIYIYHTAHPSLRPPIPPKKPHPKNPSVKSMSDRQRNCTYLYYYGLFFCVYNAAPQKRQPVPAMHSLPQRTLARIFLADQAALQHGHMENPS